MNDDAIKKKQFILCCGAFIANGMLALSTGSLLPFLREANGLDYAFCGLIVSLHSVGNLISGFFAGTLAVMIGRKKSILLFETFFPISVLLMLSGNRPLLAFAFLATGLARGACSNYCNVKINSIAPGIAWVLNCLHACFAVGAFVFPLVLMLFTRANNGYWVYACWFLTIVGVIAWILYFIIPEDDDKKTDSGETDAKDKVRETLGFFKEPLFYICTATLFFYLCAETGVIGWMITYFKDTGLLNPNLSQVTASILWIMILAGRLTVAWLSTKYRKENLLPAMGIGIVVFFLVLIISKTTAPIIIGIMGFGYSMAGIYATTVSFAGDIIKKYNLAWSFILTIASLGSIIMPAIIGLIAENYGIAMGISSIAVALFLDMMCIMKLVTHVKKKAVV